jgi:ABC-type phosphate/phosphonate transport system substrate-binding protein
MNTTEAERAREIAQRVISMGTIWLGAVAYDPKIVAIWEGIRAYFHEEARLDLEVMLFLSYDAQVDALLGGPNGGPRIDIAWNTNLAYLQCERWSEGRTRPLAMRDTDLGWTTKIIAPRGGAVRRVEDLRGKTLALGSRDSGHAAILPVHFLAHAGLAEGRDYLALRFDTDVGKHGDTGQSEVQVLKAVLEGTADAGAVGGPFWQGVLDNRLAPEGALTAVWTSPAYSHCMFTARVGFEAERAEAFVCALEGMRWDDPKHRAVLEAEGLRKWLRAETTGYASLREAAAVQGHFGRP